MKTLTRKPQWNLSTVTHAYLILLFILRTFCSRFQQQTAETENNFQELIEILSKQFCQFSRLSLFGEFAFFLAEILMLFLIVQPPMTHFSVISSDDFYLNYQRLIAFSGSRINWTSELSFIAISSTRKLFPSHGKTEKSVTEELENIISANL